MFLPSLPRRPHHGKAPRSSSTEPMSPLWVSDLLFFLIYPLVGLSVLQLVWSPCSLRPLGQRRGPVQMAHRPECLQIQMCAQEAGLGLCWMPVLESGRCSAAWGVCCWCHHTWTLTSLPQFPCLHPPPPRPFQHIWRISVTTDGAQTLSGP